VYIFRLQPRPYIFYQKRKIKIGLIKLTENSNFDSKHSGSVCYVVSKAFWMPNQNMFEVKESRDQLASCVEVSRCGMQGRQTVLRLESLYLECDPGQLLK
jgi:hypothetical protein